MGIRASLRRQRQGLELLFSHAFPEARAHYRFEPRPAKGGCVLFQSRLPRSFTASSFRNSLLPRASQPLPSGTLYFHAQFRQGQPNHGWTSDWKSNGDPKVDGKTNLDGKDNYVWVDATGRGHFVGVTMSVFQNQDGWWGEGDDMFFVDGESRPSINGTGSEDYFLGAWDFGGHPFSYRLYGAPVVGEERAGGKSSVYRFHMDSPITFAKSLRASIEHGHANHRSDNYYSVAYWYQTEPHAPFPVLPSVDQRIPRLQLVGGPGNPAVVHP